MKCYIMGFLDVLTATRHVMWYHKITCNAFAVPFYVYTEAFGLVIVVQTKNRNSDPRKRHWNFSLFFYLWAFFCVPLLLPPDLVTLIFQFYTFFELCFCLHWISCVSQKFHFSSKSFSECDVDFECFSMCSVLCSKILFTFALQFFHLLTLFLHISTDFPLRFGCICLGVWIFAWLFRSQSQFKAIVIPSILVLNFGENVLVS